MHYSITTIIGTDLALRRAINWINGRYRLSETSTQSVHLQMRASSMTDRGVTLFNHPSLQQIRSDGDRPTPLNIHKAHSSNHGGCWRQPPTSQTSLRRVCTLSRARTYTITPTSPAQRPTTTTGLHTHRPTYPQAYIPTGLHNPRPTYPQAYIPTQYADAGKDTPTVASYAQPSGLSSQFSHCKDLKNSLLP